MNDRRVSAAQDQLDDEARAEDRRDGRLDSATNWLNNHNFEILSNVSGFDFIDWYTDKYEDGSYDWVDDCKTTSSWYCKGVEVDTLAVATAFIDWIGEE